MSGKEKAKSDRPSQAAQSHAASAAAAPAPAPSNAGAVSLILTLWFALVAVAFWGPYVIPVAQLTAFSSICTALYGVMLLIVVGWSALTFLRRRTAAEGKTADGG